MKQILATSITITILKRAYNLCRFIKQRVIDIYSNSQTDKLTKAFGKKTEICLQNCFLGKITDIREKDNNEILEKSRAVQCLINFYKRQRVKINNFLNTSKTVGLTKIIKEKVYILPVKVLSIIMVAGVVINLTLSGIIQREINLWDWMAHGLVLFLGIGGLFCNINWPTLKNNSAIIRLIKNAKD